MISLRRVAIYNYKNLNGIYSFENSKGYVALIGLNGSGKSNLLEAISIIFDGLINNNGTGIPFDYEIEYGINGHIYTRKKRQATKDGIICKAEELEFPSSLIACYSGEDLRLWHVAYEKYHMGYFNEAVKQTYSSPAFLYINKYCWKIALISLLCSNNDNVKVFLKNTLKINSPIDVELDLSYDDTRKDGFQAHAALNWFDRIVQDGHQNINLNIIATTDIYIAGRQVLEEQKAKYVFNFLYLLSQPKKNEKNKIDKLIEDIQITVNNRGRKLNFDDLSEGEKKLILIECITKVLGEENSLVLLDEPDAHTHIAMKKDLLKFISEFKGQTIMTTHSPMFLNKRWDGYDENNIFYIHDGKIEDTEPLKHLSELTDNEIDYFEGSFILSSKKILVVEGKYDDKYLKKAINIFAKNDAKYNRLNDVTIFSANSAGSAEVIYNQILSNSINRIEKLVFLFDYDDGGWKDGWKKIEQIPNRGTKIIPMFYQDSYASANYPTTDEGVTIANGGSKTIKSDKSYMVEDLFSENAYTDIITPVINARKHKDFRNLPYGKKGTAGRIKEYIESNYDNFTNEAYDGFKVVLDELLNVFELN
ncbi:MAG: AAA family ATPase [Bacteroidales bacterium]|nr:AAA family ATPase [Candidatus Equimonas faecalis]